MINTFTSSCIYLKQKFNKEITSIDELAFQNTLITNLKNLEKSIKIFLSSTKEISVSLTSEKFQEIQVEREKNTNKKFYNEKNSNDNIYQSLTIILALANSLQYPSTIQESKDMTNVFLDFERENSSLIFDLVISRIQDDLDTKSSLIYINSSLLTGIYLLVVIFLYTYLGCSLLSYNRKMITLFK